MRRFEAILIFYKPFVLWSFVANIVIALFNPALLYALVAKLFLIVFLWYYSHTSPAKRQLDFCHNKGISTFQLFASIFVVDGLVMIPYLLLIREFI